MEKTTQIIFGTAIMLIFCLEFYLLAKLMNHFADHLSPVFASAVEILADLVRQSALKH